MRLGVGVSGLLPVILLLLVASSPGLADPVSVSLVFTSFQGQGTASGGPNVFTVSFNWNGTTVTLGAATPLATTNGADGIVINPLNGNYLIGGQQNGLVNQITPSGVAVSSVASNNVTALGDVAGAYHLKVDPSGNTLYVMAYSPSYTGPPSGDVGGGIAAVPLSPSLTAGVNQLISGSDNRVTDIAFDPNNQTTYYTSSPFTGTGDFGTINLGTGVTSNLLTQQPWAHGILYDPFTGDLIMMGANEIAQFDPTTNTVVSTIVFNSGLSAALDQGIVDGAGHLWVAANDGNLVFVDFQATKNIGTGVSNINFLHDSLDELTFTSTPEPATVFQLAGALACLGLGIYRRRPR